MAELEKRVEQLEQEVKALTKQIADMPKTVGEAVLKSAKRTI
ncbi:MAG: hypothetical protein AB9917_21900 [Negativicutes bacterium]